MGKKIQRILYKLFGVWGTMTIECKQCSFESPFALVTYYHVKHKHSAKPTKRDLFFIFKYNLIFRLLMCSLILIAHVVGWILWLVTYPFWAIHEIFD